ncbi:MAG TPA: DUF6491 family protein [Woeseiaceae bacterium]|nr:DUF6491 family protein [Woeseiaceae bacterium]
MPIKQIVITLFASGLLACAARDEAPDSTRAGDERTGSDCIFSSSIRGYTVLDESNLIVEAGARRHYHLVLQRRAYGLKSSWTLGFESPTGRICPGFSEVHYNGGMDSGSIRIHSIRELSKEEHDYLLIQYGKKKPEIEQTPVPNEVQGAEVEELDPAASGD